jgi:NADPH2:quinone reductase
MKAVVVTELGSAPVLRDVPEPERGEGEALLEVLAAPLNPVDLSVASGRFFAGSPPLPYVAGAEAVGRVLEADSVAEGAVVWTGMQGLGVSRDGALAERAVAREDGLVAVPGDADPALAAALGIAGVAGWLPLEWRAPVRAGETVLVLGATGTVGLVAVQAAKLLGAGRVIAAGRRSEGLQRAQEAGADATVQLDGSDDLAGELRRACGGDGPNLIVDPLWGAPAAAALVAAAPQARLIQLGQSAGADAAISSGAVRGKSLEILGYTNLRAPFDALAAGYARLVEHASAGRIRVDVERLPLDDAVDAWRRQAEGPDTKLVIVPRET